MPVITNTAPGTLVVPGSYIAEPAAQPLTPQGANTSVLYVVGSGTYGIPNTLINANGDTGVIGAVGANTQLPFSISDAVLNGAIPEAKQFGLVRVTDGTDTSATVEVLDATGYASLAIAGNGVVGAGQTAAVSLVNGATVVAIAAFALTPGATAAQACAAIAAAIAASTAASGPVSFVSVAAAGAAFTVTALVQGVAGNAITIQVTITGAGFAANPAAVTPLAGGAAPGSLGLLVALSTGSGMNDAPGAPVGYILARKTPAASTSPMYRLTLFSIGGAIEVFDSLPAFAVAGGGYDAPTLQASIGAAVNSGSSNRAPSAFWIFAAGTSVAAPLLGAYQGAAGGTDGANGITTSILLGQNLPSLRTGMYVLHDKISAAQFIIAGLLDCTAAQTIAAFAQTEKAISAIALGPAGTTVDEAVMTKDANNVSNRFLIACIEDPSYRDPTTGTAQLKNPVGTVMGTIASLAPYESPLNKPEAGKVGVLSTEWTQTQFPDETDLQSNNIMYLKRYSGKFVLFNDLASDGTPILDTRMLNYIADYIERLGKQKLGKVQPALLNNAVINDYLSDIKAFLQPMAAIDMNGNPTGNSSPQITAYTVSGVSNTIQTIEQGFLISNTIVQTLSGIRYVLGITIVGNAVQVQQAA